MKIADNFTNIYKDTYHDILKYIIINCDNLDDVNDIIQDTYLSLYKVMEKQTIEDIRPFLFGIAKNMLKRHRRRFAKLRQMFTKEDIDDFHIKDNFILEEEVLNRITSEQIWHYLDKKNILISKTFYLFYSEGLSIKEIAQLLNKNESTIKNYLYRTKIELQNFIGKE